MEFYNDIATFSIEGNFSDFIEIDNIHLIDEKFETFINSSSDFPKFETVEFDPEATWDADEGEEAAIGLEIEEILSTQEDKLFIDLDLGLIDEIMREEEKCERIQEDLTEFLAFKKDTKKSFQLKPYTCGYCNLETNNRYYFQQHFRTAKHRKNALKLQSTETFKNEEMHFEVVGDHEIVHTHSFNCDDCGSKFRRRKNLSDHIRDVHLIYNCDKCKRRFKSEKEFNLHAMRHSKSSEFECLVCHKNFTNNQNLKRHERTHKETKKFLCSICGKNFGQKTNLMRHFKVHKD